MERNRLIALQRKSDIEINEFRLELSKKQHIIDVLSHENEFFKTKIDKDFDQNNRENRLLKERNTILETQLSSLRERVLELEKQRGKTNKI